jgi:hypothetical protein
VLDSFIQWYERTREEFMLDAQIQEQLVQRKEKLAVRHTYGEWRRMQREDPGACRMMGFEDDLRKATRRNCAWMLARPVPGRVVAAFWARMWASGRAG